MNETQNKIGLSGLEFQIGITILICLLVCKVCAMLGFSVQALAACTGAVMCVREGGKASVGALQMRILPFGIRVCGGTRITEYV